MIVVNHISLRKKLISDDERVDLLKKEAFSNEERLFLSAVADHSLDSKGYFYSFPFTFFISQFIFFLSSFKNWHARVISRPDSLPEWAAFFHRIATTQLKHKDMLRLLAASFKEGYVVDCNVDIAGGFSLILSPGKLNPSAASKFSREAEKLRRQNQPLVIADDNPVCSFADFTEEAI